MPLKQRGNMKKSLIAIIAIIAVAAALPIIGNSVMKSTIENRINELERYGIKSQNVQTDENYLTTKQHFEFLLENTDEFVNYLSQYSDQQIPPYVNAMFEGVVVGADLEYSNLPFSKAIELDIYPLELSEELSKNLQESDLDFSKYVESFLRSKGVLYHINYNIVSEDFDGYVKDIDEKHTLKDGTLLELVLSGADFTGNGKLIAPNSIATTMEALQLNVKKDNESIEFNLEKLATTTSYESKSTYISSVELDNCKINIAGTKNDMQLNMTQFLVNASSNTQGEFAELNSKSNIDTITFDSKELTFSVKDFSSDVALNSLDKSSFNEIQDLVSKARVSTTAQQEKELEEALVQLISKGLVLDIADFSVKNITLNKNENLKGFTTKAELKLKEDKDFVQKLQISPLLLISNIELTSSMKFSKEIYTKLTENRPMTAAVKEYIKEDNENIIFDFSFINGEFTLNGKKLR